MKLNELERQVLVHSQVRASVSVVKLAKELGVKEHKIRYAVSRLESGGFIIARYPAVNVYKLGFTDFGVYLSRTDNPQSRSKFIDFVTTCPRVAWVADLGGDYQYALSVYARNSIELQEFLGTISESSSGRITEKSIAMRVRWDSFASKYLLKKPVYKNSISFGGSVPPYAIDEKDHEILKAMYNAPDLTHSTLARHTGIPLQTVDYRVKKMEESGLITGYLCRLDYDKIDINFYRAMITERGVSAAFEKKLFEFSRAHPHIIGFVKCLGNWDFELRIEAEKASDAKEVIHELNDAFPDNIQSMKTFSSFNLRRIIHYPFVDFHDVIGKEKS